MNPNKLLMQKMKIKQVLTVFPFMLMLLFSHNAFSQIKGKVTDVNGAPIPGVSVVVQGTTIGTLTDINGNYSLTTDSESRILTFSFIGMKSISVTIAGRTEINVTLETEEQTIDEVVVIGYGTQRKESVTGAIASTSIVEVKRSTSANLSTAIAGRISGLTALQTGGRPGFDYSTLYLRGAATTNETDPLILIDGVARENMNTLDPAEIETISVLKDASATALFGVQGANGVILINTKRGALGKMRLTVDAKRSYQSFTREPERIHSLEYMRLRNEAVVNDGQEPVFTEEVMAKYANPLAGLDPNAPDYEEQKAIRLYMYCDHDWYRELIKQFVPLTRMNINASGGTEKLSYFVNASFIDQKGNLNTEPKSYLGYDPSVWMKRYSLRTNLDFKLTSSLKSFLNIGTYIEQANMPSATIYGNDDFWAFQDYIYQTISMTPITIGPVTLPGFGVEPGRVIDSGYLWHSPYEMMNRTGSREELKGNLNSSFGLEWDLSNSITKGLSVKAMLSFDSHSYKSWQGSKAEILYLADLDYENDQLSYSIFRFKETTLSLASSSMSRYKLNSQVSINYKNTFGQKHDLTGMLLAQRDNWDTYSNDIPFNVIGVAGRFTYAYDQKYFAEVNMGYNGSEQFAPSKRYGFFPAVSASWVVSKENFLKNNSIITNLKLRASYGVVGNDKMGSARFLYQDKITVGSGGLGSISQGQRINLGLLGNPNLGWEVAKKQNYGVDIQLIKSLNLSLDYYFEHRSNILITRGNTPALQGIPLSNVPKGNLGIVDNEGLEIELKYNKMLFKDFSLSVSGNFGYNHNIQVYADEPMSDETYAYVYRKTGYSIGQQWGFRIDYSNGNGYFNSEEELDRWLETKTCSFGTPRVGDFIYKDLNGDNVIDDRDEAPIKYSSIPGITYGLTLDASYKSFDFNVFIQGIGRYSGYYWRDVVTETPYMGTYFGYHKTAWTAERYAKGEEITYPALSQYFGYNHKPNDFFIMNRAFTRLKNIELGYTLPEGALKKLGIQNLRIFVSGQNLFTWDHLRMDHLDPENTDMVGYPIQKTQSFGFNVTF